MIFRPLSEVKSDIALWVEVLAASSAVFSAIIAFISIGIAFFSLREARRHRLSSYKPDLYLNFPITIKSRVSNFQTGVREVFCLIYDENLKESESWGIWHSIENIGLGAAKDIRIKWSFDTEKACKVISKIAPQHIQLIQDSGFLTIQDSKGEELIATSFFGDIHEPITYDFILPRKDERFKKSPSIPHPILELYTIFFLLRYDIFYRDEMPDIYFEDFREFPKLSAKMTYSDIGGKTYSKKFTCKLEMRLVEHLPEVLKLKTLEHFDILLRVGVAAP